MTEKLYTGRVPICRGLRAACLVLLSSFFVAACTTTADKFLPGAAMLSSPDSVVVFGKVEVGEFQKYLKDHPERAKRENLANRKNITLYLQTIKNRKTWGLNPPTLIVPPFVHGKDYFAIIPKENYFLVNMMGGINIPNFECQHLGFRIPQHASAVYVGTLVFQVRKISFSPFFLWRDIVPLSIRDEYDQALRHFRSRNPDFSGEIVKSLFHYEPGGADWRGGQLSCSIYHFWP